MPHVSPFDITAFIQVPCMHKLTHNIDEKQFSLATMLSTRKRQPQLDAFITKSISQRSDELNAAVSRTRK